MLTKKEAETLYQKLQNAYGPHYYPTEQEKAAAIFELQHEKIDEEDMIRKIEYLADMHGEHKTKITTLINNKYWLQKIHSGVKANKFIPED